MSREHVLVICGVLVILAPFAGIPLSWLDIGLPLLGVCICVIGLTQIKRKRSVVNSSHEAAPEETHS